MSNDTIKNAISAVLALGLSGMGASALAESSQAAPDTKTKADMSQTMGTVDGMEKCYGITKAGQNDCGSDTHSCAGASKTDSDQSSWVFVPTGSCSKIVGGSTVPPAKI